MPVILTAVCGLRGHNLLLHILQSVLAAVMKVNSATVWRQHCYLIYTNGKPSLYRARCHPKAMNHISTTSWHTDIWFLNFAPLYRFYIRSHSGEYYVICVLYIFCLDSWKWKMKTQLTCFNNRRAAWFNQPHAPSFSSSTRATSAAHDTQRLVLCNSSNCLNRIPCRNVYFSATHNCCIIFSLLPLLLFCLCT